MPPLGPRHIQAVALDVPKGALADEFTAILRSRGLLVEERSIHSDPDRSSTIIALVLEDLPPPIKSSELGTYIAKHAVTGQPPILYVPPTKRKKGKADESAASLALLRAHGAVLTFDPEVWIECLVLVAAYGSPQGPSAAIVAPPGSWLAAAAAAQARRAEHLGERFTPLKSDGSTVGATDLLLIDASTAKPVQKDAKLVIVPVAGRSYIFKDRPVLVGLATALRAAELCGEAAQRIRAGDGAAASPGEVPALDRARFQNQLNKLSDRVGDHECKVLLSSYGVAITRQAVATTPSAASRLAKKAGYPVEMKAWGAEQASENQGALVVRDIDTAAEVRRAFSFVCGKTDCEAVIVRETPMQGRELRISIREHSALGLAVYLYQNGHVEPAAALAPLREVDAYAVAHHVVASRADDANPDWDALVDLLIAASHMVADNARVIGLELTRVIVGSEGEGALVVDARAVLDSAPPTR